jgi:hypothetical protein
MDRSRRAEDPLEVVSQVRSASLQLGVDAVGGFDDPGAPLRATHVRAARLELDARGRRAFVVERWATQPIAARARIVWRGWASGFAQTLQWDASASGALAPRMRERLDELGTLLSGPATRGEVRVLEAYEAYFQTLFTLGWAIVRRADPLGDTRRLGTGTDDAQITQAGASAFNAVRAAWILPWVGRRRHDEIQAALLAWIDGSTAPAVLVAGTSYDAQVVYGRTS